MQFLQDRKQDEQLGQKDAVGQSGTEVSQPMGKAAFRKMPSHRHKNQESYRCDEGKTDETVQMEVERLAGQAQLSGDVILRFERAGRRFPLPVDFTFPLMDELVPTG